MAVAVGVPRRRRGGREREARPVVVAGQRALRLAGGAVDDAVAARRQAVHPAEALPVGQAAAGAGTPGEVAVREQGERVADGPVADAAGAHEGCRPEGIDAEDAVQQSDVQVAGRRRREPEGAAQREARRRGGRRAGHIRPASRMGRDHRVPVDRAGHARIDPPHAVAVGDVERATRVRPDVEVAAELSRRRRPAVAGGAAGPGARHRNDGRWIPGHVERQLSDPAMAGVGDVEVAGRVERHSVRRHERGNGRVGADRTRVPGDEPGWPVGGQARKTRARHRADGTRREVQPPDAEAALLGEVEHVASRVVDRPFGPVEP